MIGIDTNVLLRFLVDDDHLQNEAARRFLSERSAADPAFVSAVTLAETVWVLTTSLGYPAQDIRRMLRDLLQSDALVIEHGEELGLMLGDAASPHVGIADSLIVWAGLRAGCVHTVTFDRRAARRIPAMELLA